MKANELMIGDLIIDNYGNAARVNMINAWSDLNIVGIEILEGPQEGITIDYPIDGLEPIPLTTEILEKNGFKKVKEDGYDILDGRCWTNDIYGEYCFELTDETFSPLIIGNAEMGDKEWINIPCKYVHELQHALKLCGIEKEIVC